MNIGFIGLGNMGAPMAGHLQQKGHRVTVYNRSPAKAQAWQQQYGGQIAATPAAVAAQVELLCLCAGNDDDVRDILVGTTADSAQHGLAAGTLVIDHTTTSAQLARELADTLAARQIGFLDAPVSGGQVGAQNASLTIMCGGQATDFARAQPILMCYAQAATLMGPAGAGQLTKMVNQICIAGLLQSLAEGLQFGRQAGLDLDQVLAVIGKGAAGSWLLNQRGPTMARGEFDFGFAVDWMRKDLGLCLNEARRNGATLPVTALVDQFYAEVQKMGGNRWDTSSLMTRLVSTKTAGHE